MHLPASSGRSGRLRIVLPRGRYALAPPIELRPDPTQPRDGAAHITRTH
jgi:hypothetical protein